MFSLKNKYYFSLVILLLFTGCSHKMSSLSIDDENAILASEYDTESLAQRWRAELRKRHFNPYEGVYSNVSHSSKHYRIKRKYKHTEYQDSNYYSSYVPFL